MSLLWKVVIAIVVWVVAALVLLLLGGLLTTVGQDTLTRIGGFLKDNAGIIGFLVAVCYFFFGSVYPHPRV